jgi:hypothetical protein
MKVKFLLFTPFLFMVSCGDPIGAFYAELEKYGYIPYATPMHVAGTGTLIGGSPKSMQIIANPNTCFPNIDIGETQVRFRDDSVLPSSSMHFSVSTNLQFRLFKVLSAGAPSIQAGAQINEVGSIEMDFEGVHVEYFDSVRLVNFYRGFMSDICREYLNRVGVITQAIVVDKMRFAFMAKHGGQIHISLDNINQYIDITADAEWEIDQTWTLVVKSPKYIGYQLGALQEQDNGLSLKRASSVQLDKWVWKDIGVFPK